ncbi:Activity-regulated cytoskeleton associated protein 1 [Carabus blaptoides fortunei]
MPKHSNPSAGLTFTREQFEDLLLRITTQHREQSPTQTTATSTNHVEGNFAKCTSRFDGSETGDVEAFLEAIIIYKECINVSDENAFQGITMLLEGIAATWWKGIKSSIADWNGAVFALRETYSRKLPPPGPTKNRSDGPQDFCRRA